MTTMTQSGITVEEAIKAALQKLNVSRDEVEINIRTHGRKGFLGIGAKAAEVEVTLISSEKVEKEIQREAVPEVLESEATIVEPKTTSLEEEAQQIDAIAETQKYLGDIAKEMKILDLEITHVIDGKYVNFQLESKKAALLIGKRGQTLNALQQLAQLVVNKYGDQFKVVRIDVGDYRDRREQSLEHLAERMADKAIRTGRKVQLEPMPAYERKVIHHTLSSRLDIETHSEGADPYRYLVIEPIR